MQLEHQI